jgi:hypothetical protein
VVLAAVLDMAVVVGLVVLELVRLYQSRQEQNIPLQLVLVEQDQQLRQVKALLEVIRYLVLLRLMAVAVEAQKAALLVIMAVLVAVHLLVHQV